MARSSRPADYTLELIDRKAQGQTLQECADAFAITVQTLKNWLRKDGLSWELLDIPVPPANPTAEQMELIQGVDLIPDSFKTTLMLMEYAKNQGFEITMNEALAYQKATGAIKAELPRVFKYERPKWLTKKQIEIVEGVINGSVALEGPRQTGKTIAICVGIFESMILGKNDWVFVASTQETAQALFKKLMNDPLMSYLNNHFAIHPTGTYCTVFNRLGGTSEFACTSTTVNGVRGRTINVWADEVDRIVQGTDTKEVIPAAIALIRSNPELRCVFSMNKGSGVYTVLMKVFKKHEAKAIIRMFTLLKEDSYLKDRAGQDQRDEFIMDVQAALMGEGYARAQMLNEDSLNGQPFQPDKVQECFEMYNVYIDQLPIPPLRIMALDPSSTGHPFGIFIGALDTKRMEIIEVFACMKQLGLDNDGINWTPAQLDTFLVKIAKEFHVSIFVTESNSNGARYIHLMRPLGIRCMLQNFGGKATNNSRESFIELTNWFISCGRAYLNNPDLLQQLLLYNPDRDKEQSKGDIADALLHFTWAAVGGQAFLHKLRAGMVQDGFKST